MSSNDKHVFDTNCVCDVVKFIDELQDCASTACPTACDIPFLGANSASPVANTRPFLLYTENGELFSTPAVGKSGGGSSKTHTFCVRTPIFRVESVDDDCCAVLRALLPPGFKPDDNHDDNHNDNHGNCNNCRKDDKPEDVVCFFLEHPSVHELIATSSCITVDLKCFCAIQCLRDVRVSGV
jgi:hypothetical protein